MGDSIMTEDCAACGNKTIAGHSLSLDGSRRFWRVCCLCTAELIAKLDQVPVRQT